MNYEDLSAEQKERARSARSPEELLALAREEGYELSDQEISDITGGATWSCFSDCPTDCDNYGGPY